MQVVKIKDEHIKLGQLIKLAGLVDNGVVLVNGQIDTRRGRKIVPGDIVKFKDEEIKVEANDN